MENIIKQKLLKRNLIAFYFSRDSRSIIASLRIPAGIGPKMFRFLFGLLFSHIRCDAHWLLACVVGALLTHATELLLELVSLSFGGGRSLTHAFVIASSTCLACMCVRGKPLFALVAGSTQVAGVEAPQGPVAGSVQVFKFGDFS